MEIPKRNISTTWSPNLDQYMEEAFPERQLNKFPIMKGVKKPIGERNILAGITEPLIYMDLEGVLHIVPPRYPKK